MIDFATVRDASSSSSEPSIAPITQARVLVIAGHLGLRDAIANSLTPLGHQVVTASDGVRGFLEFLIETPDVAVFDLQLAGFDGPQLLGELRRRAPAMPVILLTTPTSPVVSSIPGVAVVQKPFLPAELNDVITSELSAVSC